MKSTNSNSRSLLARIVNRCRFVGYALYARIFSSKTLKLRNGRAVRLLTGSSHEAFRAFTFFDKEPETLAWIDGFGNERRVDAPVIFDVGANIGIYSLYAAAVVPGAKVLAFEPESQSFAALCRNVSMNGLSTITPYQIALSDESGLGELHSSSMAAGAGAAALGQDYPHVTSADHVLRQGVFMASLDHLVFELGCPFPNYIKIDVDGIEQKILNGGQKVLRDKRLIGLLVEYQYSSAADKESLRASLRESGLQLVGESAWQATYPSGLQSKNFIFQRTADQ